MPNNLQIFFFILFLVTLTNERPTHSQFKRVNKVYSSILRNKISLLKRDSEDKGKDATDEKSDSEEKEKKNPTIECLAFSYYS